MSPVRRLVPRASLAPLAASALLALLASPVPAGTLIVLEKAAGTASLLDDETGEVLAIRSTREEPVASGPSGPLGPTP